MCACVLHFNLVRSTESVPTNFLPMYFMPDTTKALHLSVYNVHDAPTRVDHHSPDRHHHHHLLTRKEGPAFKVIQ